MTTSFFGRRLLLAAAIALCAFPAVQAQGDWPRGQTIRMVVPFTAGSGTDIVARLVAERLLAEVAKIMAAPDLKERLDKLGAEPFTMPSADFDRFLADETAKAQQVVKAAGIKVD